jgi:hypothetical protein
VPFILIDQVTRSLQALSSGPPASPSDSRRGASSVSLGAERLNVLSYICTIASNAEVI